MIQSTTLLQDINVSVTRIPKQFLLITFWIWVLGCFIFLIPFVRAILGIRQLKKHAVNVQDSNILATLQRCMETCNTKHAFKLLLSDKIQSPVTFGHFKSYIILPKYKLKSLSEDELYYILLHELQHYKTLDYLINYVLFFFQIVYWFHPVLWYLLKEIRINREITCDLNVLQRLGVDEFTAYGHTILNFVDPKQQKSSTSVIMELGGSRQQVRRRIIHISNYRKSTMKQTFLSLLQTFALIFIILGFIPFLKIYSNDSIYYHKTNSGIVSTDMSSFFQGFKGTFVMYDTSADQYTIYNEMQSRIRVSPNSTYKIYSSLFGLESGIIHMGESTLPWDGTMYPYSSWNNNQDLESALKHSVTWYYQALDQQLGYKTIRNYLSEINYGNGNTFAPIKEYWLESSLKISAVEQVNLLRDFYYNNFGFSPQHIQYVKDCILLSRSEVASLSGKTGVGIVNQHQVNGWFIGYIETLDNTYFFATNIQGKDNATGTKAYEITLNILDSLGIYSKDINLSQ